MREFTVEEILEFSRNIEMESYNYYTTAAKQLADSTLKVLVEDLAREELQHYKRFNRILENKTLNREELDTRISIARKDHDKLVETREMLKNPTPRFILETAYEREINTGNLYRTLTAFTNLSDDIIQTFSDLMDQEQGHANRISNLLKKL